MTPRVEGISRVVGIVPAAGYARRLGELGCSKELLPVRPPATPGGEPEPVCHTVLRALARAGIPRAVVVTRRGKEDIAARLGAGDRLGLSLDYVTLGESPSPVHSVAAGLELAPEAVVALGFADVLYDPPDPFTPMLDRLRRGRADVVLGLFPPTSDYVTERVDTAPDGVVVAIDPNPVDADERPTWTLAVWRPSFSRFLVDRVKEADAGAAPGEPERVSEARTSELSVGALIQIAIERGLRVESVQVSETPFLDIGDPERLAEARRRLARGGPPSAEAPSS